MTVYMLAYGRPHPSEAATIVGAFSTYELAEAYATKHDLENWEVEEWQIDTLVADVFVPASVDSIETAVRFETETPDRSDPRR